MNSAKKLVNQQNKSESGKKKVSVPATGSRVLGDGGGGGSSKKPFILGAVCVLVVIILCVGVGVQQLKPKKVLTVKGTSFTMNDMMYPIYEKESQYLPMDETYQYMMGQSVWDITYQGDDSSVEAGASNAEGLKQEIINKEIEYEILYQEAKNAQYEITEEEKSKAQKQAEDALKGLTTVQKLKLDISKRKLVKRFEKRIVADRYKADQQEILNKDVDEASAIADISKKDNRQYNVEYYYAPLTSKDDEGNSSDLSKTDKKALADKMKALAKKAAKAKDFSKLIEDEEKSDIKHDTGNFTETSSWTYASDKNLKKIKALKNGEISSVFTDDSTGYYVFVKMTDNNSSEAYDKKCDDAISEAQKKKYQEWYDKLKESYNTEINSNVWDDVTIGFVTTEIVTAEDLQKMSESASSGSSE